jgi:chorismate mutase
LSNEKEKYYLIQGDILPEAIYKTVEAKRLFETGEVETVNQAVEKVGLSRSAYYKYKDKIFPFNKATYQQIITISFILEHKSGVLSQVLRFVAENGGNVLTINQSIPLQGIANVVLTVDTATLNQPTSEFVDQLGLVAGVKKVVLVGQG